MSGNTLAVAIDLAPVICIVGGILLGIRAMVISGADGDAPRVMPAISMLFLGGWICLAPSVFFEMGGLNKERLSLGKYVQREVDLGEHSELLRRQKALGAETKDGVEASVKGLESSAAVEANSKGGSLSQGAASAHSKASASKALPPEPSAEAAKTLATLEKLATPEEARLDADAQALREVALALALILGVGAAAWIVAKRKKISAHSEALPEVQFLTNGGQAGFTGAGLSANAPAWGKEKTKAAVDIAKP